MSIYATFGAFANGGSTEVVREVALLSFYPKRLKFSLFWLYGQQFPRHRPILPYLGMKLSSFSLLCQNRHEDLEFACKFCFLVNIVADSVLGDPRDMYTLFQ